MTKVNPDPQVDDGQDDYSSLNLSDTAILSDVSIDQSLYFLLKKLVDQKREKDESFDDRYSRLNYQEMITNLKYYMSDYGSMLRDPLAGEAEATYQRVPLAPKFGPLSSSSELFSIPGWNDELIELIQNEFSVYPSTQIDFNKITSNMLKILIPTLTEEDIKEFFIWRDDPEQPRYINSKADFKKYIVDQERLMNDTDFEERMKQFEQKGFTFGSNPNLFKIVSEGSYNRANYTLVAYVVLPKNAPTIVTNPGTQPGAQGGAQPGAQGATPPGTTQGPHLKTKKLNFSNQESLRFKLTNYLPVINRLWLQ